MDGGGNQKSPQSRLTYGLLAGWATEDATKVKSTISQITGICTEPTKKWHYE
jgi:hypothetical protein